MEVKVISDLDGLREQVLAWEELAKVALEANPFFEPWMLLPAFSNFGAGKELKFVLIFRHDPGQPAAPPLLCGIFPLERHERYMGLPISAWSLWKYNHCYLTAPLIRAEFARECLATFFDWLASNAGRCQVFEMRHVPGEGQFHQLLVDQLNEIPTTPFIWEWFTRAFFRPMETAQRYFSVALSGKHRKALRRTAELLAEKGSVEYVVAQPGADIAGLIETFLRIERSGWKGTAGSAMACREAHRRFFLETVTSAFERNQLLMAALRVDGKTIAQNCYFRAGRGAFHFKPAFDEEYAQFSPGFQMECELIRYLHGRPEIEWMDSCTTTDNEMYNRLFLARRTIQTLLVPVGKGSSSLVVSTIPLLRMFKRRAHALLHSASDGKIQNKLGSVGGPLVSRVPNVLS